MSPATALRQLQQAQAGLRRARQALAQIRGDDDPVRRQKALVAGWESLSKSHGLLAQIPLAAATEPVMTRQLAVERYATALLVRLRRLARNDPGALEGLDADDEGEGDDR